MEHVPWPPLAQYRVAQGGRLAADQVLAIGFEGRVAGIDPTTADITALSTSPADRPPRISLGTSWTPCAAAKRSGCRPGGLCPANTSSMT
jgi:hypothetical protein